MKRLFLLALSCLALVAISTSSSKVAWASGTGGGLNGVAAISDDNVWAVGQNPTNFHALIEHWDGTVWQIVPTPTIPGEQGSRLQGISAISANDVWAVGSLFQNNSEQTLIEHWNGTAWQLVPSPALSGTQDSRLRGISAVSSNDIWAVGSIDPLAELIEHWNGQTWSVISTSGQGDALNGVTAVSRNNAWAVGSFFDSNSTAHILIQHWNGQTWSTFTTADPGPQNNTLLAVTSTSAQDVWAVGGYTDAALANMGLVEHWNGHTWQAITGLNPAGSTNATLSGISAVSPQNVWAVGAAANALNNFATWVEHWDGHTWQRVSSPEYPGATDSILNVVAAVPHDEDVWAVGIAFTSSSELVEAWNGSAWNVVPTPTS